MKKDIFRLSFELFKLTGLVAFAAALISQLINI